MGSETMSKSLKSRSASKFVSESSAKFKTDNFKKISKLQNESSRFYFQRLNEYAKLPEQLLKCKETMDFYNLQTEFIVGLIKDYRDEAVIVSEILLEMSFPSSEITGDQNADNSEEAKLKAHHDATKIVELAKRQAEKIIEGAETLAEKTKTGNKRKSKVA